MTRITFKFSTVILCHIMMFSLTRLLLSFFKPRPRMNHNSLEPASRLFNPIGMTATDIFLYNFSSWASLTMGPFNLDSDFEDILSQFEVQTIMHNKIPKSPEHEFLIIETLDRWGKTRLFILERTVIAVNRPGRDIFEPMSDSDEVDNSPALDRILGEKFVYSAKWRGQNVQYFKPNRLTLFELVLLAYVVDMLYPEYSQLGNHFYASLVYAAVEKHFGVHPSKNADDSETQEMVYIINSHLSNKFGRWKGDKSLMVHRIEPQVVSDVINKYKEVYPQEITKVFLFIYDHSNSNSYHLL